MNDFRKLPRSVRVYVLFVVVLGSAALAHSILSLIVNPIPPQWILLAALTILTGSFSVKIPSLNAYLSVSEAFVFASFLLFGTAAGTVTVLLECLVIVLWMQPNGRPPHRILFNMAAPSVAIWTSGTAFYSLSKIEPYTYAVTPLSKLFVPLLAFALLYFLLNSCLVALAVGLEDGKSPVKIWWNNFAWLSVNYFSGASLAAVIVTYTRDLQISTLVVIVPLLVVSYLTFRTAMGRAEDSYNHLSTLNRLYFSTIETLAMAIDAKDQITHGHIRRVQRYAIRLATQIGVSDENLLSAIEAAALLHDMGKLAIPEHILNKPGRLTTAEFEKMKLHASVGADILSAIDFPYPVVPIVRHHHENWDGTGYPSGLCGADIPIGARILSVVDCFDALTSHRPYRAKLSDADAIRILTDRRGTMYDPLIVDTFIRVLDDISPDPPVSSPVTISHSEVIDQPLPSDYLNGTQNTAPDEREGLLTLYEISLGNESRMNVMDTVHTIAAYLAPVVPYDLLVFYAYEEECDELVAKLSVGPIGLELTGLRIPIGQRLSGWVAANRCTIANSDPSLDLMDMAQTKDQPLKNCLSVPLCADRQLLGVLSLYSANVDGFHDDQKQIVEVVCRNAAWTIKIASEFQGAGIDTVTGLPTSRCLQHLLNALNFRVYESQRQDHALISIVVDGYDKVVAVHGRKEADRLAQQVSKRIQAALRPTDLLFRVSDDSFKVLVVPSDLTSEWAIVERVMESAQTLPLVASGACSILVERLSAGANRQRSTTETDAILTGQPVVSPPRLVAS